VAGAWGDRESKNSGKGLPFFGCDLNREIDQALEIWLSLNFELERGGVELCGEGGGRVDLDRGCGARGDPAGEVEGGGGFGCDRLDGDPAQLRSLVGGAGEWGEKEKREGEAEGEGNSRDERGRIHEEDVLWEKKIFGLRESPSTHWLSTWRTLAEEGSPSSPRIR
jgi:hypothetical protein